LITLQLADGNSIPQLGLGVYEMSDKETYASVKWALQAGYKHIDTAEWYAIGPDPSSKEADSVGTRMKRHAVRRLTST
jgi:diketogulonate reductase-like aldo/keto reductase